MSPKKSILQKTFGIGREAPLVCSSETLFASLSLGACSSWCFCCWFVLKIHFCILIFVWYMRRPLAYSCNLSWGANLQRQEVASRGTMSPCVYFSDPRTLTKILSNRQETSSLRSRLALVWWNLIEYNWIQALFFITYYNYFLKLIRIVAAPRQQRRGELIKGGWSSCWYISLQFDRDKFKRIGCVEWDQFEPFELVWSGSHVCWLCLVSMLLQEALALGVEWEKPARGNGVMELHHFNCHFKILK